MKTKVTTKRKVKKIVPVGTVHVLATFNNTIITVSDLQGDVIATASSGGCGFKGSKKSTPYAAQKAMEKAMLKAKDFGLKTVYVKVCGPGSGRESAIRAIHNDGVTVTSIKDVTPCPHNGCRPPKRRRV
jgi:small subunit ribosomal protein S11